MVLLEVCGVLALRAQELVFPVTLLEESAPRASSAQRDPTSAYLCIAPVLPRDSRGNGHVLREVLGYPPPIIR